MPIYEYECTKCHHITEALQYISDPPVTRCQKCKGKVKKLISHSTFHLKGTGWYVTDYANKRSAPGGKGEESSEKDTSSKKSSEKSTKKASTESTKKKD